MSHYDPASGRMKRDMYDVESEKSAAPIVPPAEQRVTPSAHFVQGLGGLCFAHGEYGPDGCPQWPKCSTDPQVFKRVAPSAETGDWPDAEAFLAKVGLKPLQHSLDNGLICLPMLLDAYHSYRLSNVPPAATNCCTATEVEAARNPERTLEERAQEAAEAIVFSLDRLPTSRTIANVKAIILSRIGGAE